MDNSEKYLNMESGHALISWNFSPEVGIGALIVGDKTDDEKVNIINVILGEEGKALFEQLMTHRGEKK